MIHYKFEGCSEVREANIQFDPDNNVIAKRILKHLFGDKDIPCTIEFVKEEKGIYIFKKTWASVHVYKEKKPKVLKIKRRWKETSPKVLKIKRRWKENDSERYQKKRYNL